MRAPSPEDDVQRLGGQTFERTPVVDPSEEEVVVPFHVQERAAATPESFESRDHVPMVRADEIGRADPDGEQVAEDRKTADVAREVVEKPDEGPGFHVVFAQVSIAQQGDRTVS